MNKDAEVSKPLFIAIIAVVVIVVCFVGYRVLAPQKATVSDATRAAYMKRQNAGPTTYTRSMGSPPSSGGN